jgi:hypothetical protein
MLNARYLLLPMLAAAALGACKKSDLSPLSVDAHRGRYAGVGIYAPGAGWARQMAGGGAATTAARLEDDEAVIVVIDSQTGEVRACGDLSGYCIGMNPWNAALAKPQQTPVGLSAHARPPAVEEGRSNAAAER